MTKEEFIETLIKLAKQAEASASEEEKMELYEDMMDQDDLDNVIIDVSRKLGSFLKNYQ